MFFMFERIINFQGLGCDLEKLMFTSENNIWMRDKGFFSISGTKWIFRFEGKNIKSEKLEGEYKEFQERN